MNERRARRVALAILAVVAVALAATAAPAVFSQDQGGGPAGGQQPTTNASAGGTAGSPVVPIEPFMIGLVVVAVLAIGLQFVEDPRGTLLQALGVLVFIGIAVGLVQLLGELNRPSGPPDQPGAAPNTTTPSNASSGFGQGTSDPFVLPIDTIVTIAVAAGALGLVAMLAWRSERVRSAVPGLAGADDEDQDADLAAVGSRAGDAAEQVTAASTPRAADNAIYRAWRDLVGLLDVPDPQSSTPRQFATAAVEAGMDEEDVSVLTTTFEEVRYGDAALSTERRERATAALRRIEGTHGAESDDTGAAGRALSADAETERDATAGAERDANTGTERGGGSETQRRGESSANRETGGESTDRSGGDE